MEQQQEQKEKQEESVILVNFLEGKLQLVLGVRNNYMQHHVIYLQNLENCNQLNYWKKMCNKIKAHWEIIQDYNLNYIWLYSWVIYFH